MHDKILSLAWRLFRLLLKKDAEYVIQGKNLYEIEQAIELTIKRANGTVEKICPDRR